MARSMVIVGSDSAPVARHRLDPPHPRLRPQVTPDFADVIRAELRPEGVAESVAADRIVRALGILQEGGTRCDRAERSLVLSLRAIAQLRSLRNARHEESAPAAAIGLDDELIVDSDAWRSRLLIDPSVSESSPVVRGTWITVGQVVSRIIDGWTWADLLRTHPELCEDDIRACLAFATEDEANR